MRLGRTLLLTAFFLTALIPSTQAGPVQEQRLAFAEWKGKQFDRNHWEWFGAFVYEEASVGAEREIFGGVFEGRCVRKRKPDGVLVSCHGTGKGMSRNDTFTMDPAATSAVLDIEDRTFHHHVEWAASNEGPGFFQSESGCPAGQGHGGGIVRDARTTGDVFGRHFESKGSSFWNMLWTGVHVTQCGLLSEEEIADIMDGGGFTLHRSWAMSQPSPRLAI